VAVATPTYERAAGRKKLAKSKKALPDGSFPIPNTTYLKKAIRAVGRAAPGKRPALARLIRKRASQLGSEGQAVLKGSWADNSQSKKQMAGSLYGLLVELGTSADQALVETREYLTLEFATPVAGSSDGPKVTKLAGGGKTKKKWDPDNDGDNDASASGDTDKDMAGKLSPKARGVMRKLITQRKMSPSAAYKIACNVDKMGKKGS
jgi:hypothetical protein